MTNPLLMPPMTRRAANEHADTVFEMIGGVNFFAEWAAQNPGDFFTKIYAKNMSRDVEVRKTTLEMYIEALDSRALAESLGKSLPFPTVRQEVAVEIPKAPLEELTAIQNSEE